MKSELNVYRNVKKYAHILVCFSNLGKSVTSLFQKQGQVQISKPLPRQNLVVNNLVGNLVRKESESEREKRE